MLVVTNHKTYYTTIIELVNHHAISSNPHPTHTILDIVFFSLYYRFVSNWRNTTEFDISYFLYSLIEYIGDDNMPKAITNLRSHFLYSFSKHFQRNHLSLVSLLLSSIQMYMFHFHIAFLEYRMPIHHYLE